MIYGRVIGNELRDVPPECLPVWGQRWAGYRTPQGPSPFSTRILSVAQMSEVGPILTSPTQFERTLTEDEGMDTGSESSPVYSAFPLSPLTIRTDVIELPPQVETSFPLSVPPSSSHPHDSSEVSHRSTGHRPPRNLRRGATRMTSLSRRQCTIQYHEAELLSNPPTVHDDLPAQPGPEQLEQGYDPWNIDYISTSIRAGLSQGNRGQLQFTTSPHSMVEREFSDTHTQSSAYPLQPNPSSHSFAASQHFQANDRHRMIPTTPPSFTHFSALPLPQQYAGIDTSWSHDSMTSSIAYPRNLMMPQWPSIPPDQSFSSTQSPGPSSAFYRLVSDHHESSSHPEDLLGTFPYSDSCTMLSLEKPECDQFNG